LEKRARDAAKESRLYRLPDGKLKASWVSNPGSDRLVREDELETIIQQDRANLLWIEELMTGEKAYGSYGGGGVALSWIRPYLQELGGQITVNTGDGATTFSIELPLVDNAQAAGQKGGIDLAQGDKALEVQSSGSGADFQFNSGAVQDIQISGLQPVILGIEPMTMSIAEFAGARS